MTFWQARRDGVRDFVGVRRPGSPVLFALTMIVFAVGWGANEHNSCLRTNGTHGSDRTYFTGVASRARERAQVETGRVRALDLQTFRAARAVALANRQLDCGPPFPATR